MKETSKKKTNDTKIGERRGQNGGLTQLPWGGGEAGRRFRLWSLRQLMKNIQPIVSAFCLLVCFVFLFSTSYEAVLIME